MRITNGQSPRPITPQQSDSTKAVSKSQSQTKATPADPGKVADERCQAQNSAGAKLLHPAGSAAEFETVGMKVLMETAQTVPIAHDTKIGLREAQREKPAEQQEVPRNQAWANVAKSIFATSAAVTSTAEKTVAGHIQKGDFKQATSSWKNMVGQSPPTDINSTIQQVLRESYAESNNDLRFHADKVKHFNELKGELRGQIGQMQSSLATDESVADAIKQMEEDLQSVGDDSQLANIDLQNALQKQQQTLQTMSSIAKMLHDTGMAVIRKIG